jgi:hypothetical protein
MVRLRSPVRHIRKYLQLSPAERKTLLCALWMLRLIAWALRLLGFERCQAILIRLASLRIARSSGPIERDLAQARIAARMIGIASGIGYCRVRCLPQSLVLWWMMQRQGICVDVFFGVRKDEHGVNAHAWVELAGVVLNDGQGVHDHFAAFRSAFSAAGLQTGYVQKPAFR